MAAKVSELVHNVVSLWGPDLQQACISSMDPYNPIKSGEWMGGKEVVSKELRR